MNIDPYYLLVISIELIDTIKYQTRRSIKLVAIPLYVHKIVFFCLFYGMSANLRTVGNSAYKNIILNTVNL